MRFLVVHTALVAAFVGIGLYTSLAETSATSARLKSEGEVTLYGSDEFTGSPNSRPLPRLWNVVPSDGRPSDDGAQVYTSDLANAGLNGAGHLLITARRAGEAITSARVTTFTTLNFDRGMLQARIRMPKGPGLRPSIKMVSPSAFANGENGTGAIDIAVTTEDGRIRSGVRGPWVSRPQPRADQAWSLGREYALPDEAGDRYHIFWLRKEEDDIAIGLDDNVVVDCNRRDMPAGGRWVLNQPLVLEISLDVDEDEAAEALRERDAAEMVVDSVRFYG